MSFPAYSAYKDSGVDWLGTIPEHWDVTALKRFCDVRDGTHDTPEYVSPSDFSIPLVTSKDISAGKICLAQTKHISLADHEEISKRSGVSRGDILMPMIGTIGGAAIVSTNEHFSVKNIALFKLGDFSSNWLRYLLDSDLSFIQFDMSRSGGVQGFVSLGALRNLTFPRPEIDEQKRIARFLDHETARIDALIEEQQRLIELLK